MRELPFHPGFRPDIQMARALAVSAVLAFHLWPGSVPAGFLGVDVFFVISGYLITALLLREVARTGSVKWSAFWKRRALRLLPASFLVLLAVAGFAVSFGDPGTVLRTLGDTVAAVFYVENWHLAARATNYFALTSTPSPLQHFWSLAVEEQFYVLWPILLEVTLVLATALRRSDRSAIFGVLAGLTLCSFGYGVLRAQSPTAHFDSFARAWEFGLGGLLAFVPTAAELKRDGKVGQRLFGSVGWLGLTLVLVSFLLDLPHDVLPGTTALMPVAGTALLVWAGQDENAAGLSSFSRAWPLQWLGHISYSLYLWHWPLIVFAPAVFERAPALAVLAVSLVIASLSERFVEAPFRTGRLQAAAPRPVLLGFLGASVALSGLIGLSAFAFEQQIDRVAELQPLVAKCLAAHAVLGDATGDECAAADATVQQVVPAIAGIPRAGTTVDCWIEPRGEFNLCRLGAVGSTRKIALYGDSHASALSPAVSDAAKALGLELDLFTGWDCRAQATSSPACTAKPAIVRALQDGHYELVLLTNARAYGDHAADASHASYAEFIQLFTSQGTKVAVIEDGPVITRQAMGCLSRSRGNLASAAGCGEPVDTAVTEQPDLLARAAVELEVAVLRLPEVLCRDGRCPVVIGKSVVYLDAVGSHLINPFSHSLSGWTQRFIAGQLVAPARASGG